MSEKKKILIIDDEPDFLFLVKSNLEDTGRFECVTSDKPEEAEDIIMKEEPDLILVDNIMPKRKGSEIVEAIKNHPDIEEIPIIMVSGRGEMVYIKKKKQFKWKPNTSIVRDRGEIVDSNDVETLAEAYGVNDYVSKPFVTEMLIQVIEEVLVKANAKKAKDSDIDVKSDDDLLI